MNEQEFGKQISIINNAAQAYFTQRLKPYNIGPRQQAYLLSLQPGECIMQEELARRLHVDKANVTRAIRALEKEGYVQRNGCETDRRVVEITLTEKGLQVRSEVEKIAQAWVEKLREPLDDAEWERLLTNLNQIADTLR